MRRVPFVLGVLITATAACGRIDIRSVRTGESVPAALAGEWTGTWQSSRSTANGSLVLRMQDFAGEPVVSIHLDNPCVQAGDYQFRTSGNTVELLEDGDVLFTATLGPARSLVGHYGCDSDAGAWDATWTRELPSLVDLSGRWEGEVVAFGVPSIAMVLQLEQVVRSGALALEGTASVPDLLTAPIPIAGLLRFQTGTFGQPDTFELSLDTPAGLTPAVHMLGVGATAERRVHTGLVQANGQPSLPFVQAAWQARWISSGPN